MLSLSDLIKKVLGLYGSHFRIIFGAILLTLLWNVGFAFVDLFAVPGPILGLVIFISFLVSAFTELTLVGIFSRLLEGTPASVAPAMTIALKRLPLFLALLILWSLTILAGMLLLIIPAIIFGVWFLFLSVVFLVEQKGLIETFRRSRMLTRGYFFPLLGRTAFMVLAAFFIASAATQGLFTVLNLVTPASALIVATRAGNAFGAVLSALLLPIVTGTIVTLYYEMRKLKG